MKFGRTYTLTIQTNPLTLEEIKRFGIAGGSYTGNIPSNPGTQEIVIANPLTINFTVTTSLLASAHIADIEITNLGQSLRELIYKDITDDRIYRSVTLAAGYEDKQAVIFKGNILYASSVRQGVDWKTSIHAWDGGYGINNGFTSRSYASETLVSTIIKDLIKDMPRAKLKYMSPITDTTYKAVYSGNSWGYINDIWADYGHAYIDREEVFLTRQYEALKSGAIDISAESGLLETPRKFQTKIDIKMLFEPTIRIGQMVNIISEVREANGLAKVVGMNHSGIISDAISGELITTLELWNGENQPFETVILS